MGDWKLEFRVPLGEGSFSWVGVVLEELRPAEPGDTPPDEMTLREL